MVGVRISKIPEAGIVLFIFQELIVHGQQTTHDVTEMSFIIELVFFGVILDNVIRKGGHPSQTTVFFVNLSVRFVKNLGKRVFRSFRQTKGSDSLMVSKSAMRQMSLISYPS